MTIKFYIFINEFKKKNEDKKQPMEFVERTKKLKINNLNFIPLTNKTAHECNVILLFLFEYGLIAVKDDATIYLLFAEFFFPSKNKLKYIYSVFFFVWFYTFIYN